MKFLLYSFILCAFQLTAFSQNQNYEMYCGKWEKGWKVASYQEDTTILDYTFLHNGENKSNWTEMAGMTTYKSFFSLNIEQIMNKLLVDMKPKYGKAKFTMVDKNVYGDYPFVIFMIETENFNKTKKSQSMIQHIVKGPEFTHTAYYIVKDSHISGGKKRDWEKFFKSVKVQTISSKKWLEESGIGKG